LNPQMPSPGDFDYVFPSPTTANMCVGWNDLPYEIREQILYAFCEAVLDDYSDLENRLEEMTLEEAALEHPELSATPGPLSSFKSALLVSRDMYGIIMYDVKFEGKSAQEVLKKMQREMVLPFIDLLEERGSTRLWVLRTVIGHFWKNFEPEESEIGRLICKVASVLEGLDEQIWIAQIGDFVQHIDRQISDYDYYESPLKHVPCLETQVTRHILNFAPKHVFEWDDGEDFWDIYRLCYLTSYFYNFETDEDEELIVPDLPCCGNLWTEMSRSRYDDPWFCFWWDPRDIEREPVREQMGRLCFVSYKRKIFYHVENGTTTRLDGIWEYVK
jgi:hypothetical protein